MIRKILVAEMREELKEYKTSLSKALKGSEREYFEGSIIELEEQIDSIVFYLLDLK